MAYYSRKMNNLCAEQGLRYASLVHGNYASQPQTATPLGLPLVKKWSSGLIMLHSAVNGTALTVKPHGYSPL